jgi:hypothetical protein
MLTAVKMGKISLECSRQTTVLSSGFSPILEQLQVIHIALQEILLTVKKFLLPNILVQVSPLCALG